MNKNKKFLRRINRNIDKIKEKVQIDRKGKNKQSLMQAINDVIYVLDKMNKNMNKGKDEKDKDFKVYITPDEIISKNVFPSRPFFREKVAQEWFQAVKFNDFLKALPKADEAQEEEDDEETMLDPNASAI